MDFPGFCGPSYRSRYPILGVDLCGDLFLERTQIPDRPWALRRRPGRSLFATAGVGPIRAEFAEDDRAFVISGGDLCEVFASGAVTTHYSGFPPGGYGTISSDGDVLFIVVGGLGYIFTLATNTIGQIPTVDSFPVNALMGAYENGYFIVLHSDGVTFGISQPFDGMTWNDVASKTLTSDKIVAIAVDRTELRLIGSETTEVWYQAGGAFAYTPVPNVVIKQGTPARMGFATLGETLYWLARSKDGAGVIMRAQGYTPERVSTHGIEQLIQSYPADELAGVKGYSYEEDGHRFAVFAFPSMGAIAFDEATNQWHERFFYNTGTGTYEADLAVGHMYAHGLHLVTSRRDGKIYRQSMALTSDDGAPIRWRRRAATPTTNNRRGFYPGFEVFLQAGVGTSAQNNPKVWARWSNDLGRTWGAEVDRTLGAQGEFEHRVYWEQTGSGRNRVFELAGSDGAIIAIVGAELPGAFAGAS